MFGSQEVPPVNTGAWGFVRFFFSEDRLSAEYSVDVKGMSSNLVLGADIHRGRPGVAGPVVKHLADGGFLVTSGRLRLTPAELEELSSGTWYVSLKSAEHPEGEIRGQIVLPPAFLPQRESAPAPVEPARDRGLAPDVVPPPAPSPAVRIVAPSTGSGGLLP